MSVGKKQKYSARHLVPANRPIYSFSNKNTQNQLRLLSELNDDIRNLNPEVTPRDYVRCYHRNKLIARVA